MWVTPAQLMVPANLTATIIAEEQTHGASMAQTAAFTNSADTGETFSYGEIDPCRDGFSEVSHFWTYVYVSKFA